MRYYRCKCGEAEMWNSNEPISDCMGCEKCQTTFADSPEKHKPLQPHELKIQYDKNTGKPHHYICKKCGAVVSLEEKENKNE